MDIGWIGQRVQVGFRGGCSRTRTRTRSSTSMAFSFLLSDSQIIACLREEALGQAGFQTEGGGIALRSPSRSMGSAAGNADVSLFCAACGALFHTHTAAAGAAALHVERIQGFCSATACAIAAYMAVHLLFSNSRSLASDTGWGIASKSLSGSGSKKRKQQER